MTMNKHGNTYAPQDKVAPASSSGTKLASSDQGTVISGDPSSGKIEVAWGDGRTEWVAREDLRSI